MHNTLPDIPRVYTALAESFSCILYILWYVKKNELKKSIAIALLMSIGQVMLQYVAGLLPIQFWLIGMLVNLVWMFLTVYISTNLDFKLVLYTSLKAFVIAEFIASFAWQVFVILLWNRTNLNFIFITLFIIVLYVLILSIVYYIEKNYTLKNTVDRRDRQEIIIMIFIVSIIFLVSNIGFLLATTDYNLGNSFGIYTMRTISNFNGICIIFLLQIQKYDGFLKNEIDKINNVFSSKQYEKYIAYKENGDLIKQKLHDLKHHVYIIKAEENIAKKNKKIDRILEEINNMNAEIETGNVVLDTILTSKNIYCIEQKIIFTCFVDGKLLNFLDVLDICNLFGNALDNAIEFVEKQKDIEKRIINLKVCEKNNFVVIKLDNYCEEEPKFENGLPVTTKKDKNNHGYGLKSIKYTTEKYKGNMTVSYKNNWFTVKILLPIYNLGEKNE